MINGKDDMRSEHRSPDRRAVRRGPEQAPGKHMSYEEERQQRRSSWNPSEAPGETYANPAPGIGNRTGSRSEHTSRGHRGKGPKGYVRSDERLWEKICERMTEDDRLDASEIEVSVEDGEVTLTGTVRDRRAKRYAEDLVDTFSGIKDIHNLLRPTEPR